MIDFTNLSCAEELAQMARAERSRWKAVKQGDAMSTIRLDALCECGNRFMDHNIDSHGVMSCASVGCSYFKEVEREPAAHQDSIACEVCGQARSQHGFLGGRKEPFEHMYSVKGDASVLGAETLKILNILTDAQLDVYLKGRASRQKKAVNHSPFPWQPREGMVYDAAGIAVANALFGKDESRWHENARILSCAGEGVELARHVRANFDAGTLIRSLGDALLKKAGIQ